MYIKFCLQCYNEMGDGGHRRSKRTWQHDQRVRGYRGFSESQSFIVSNHHYWVPWHLTDTCQQAILNSVSSACFSHLCTMPGCSPGFLFHANELQSNSFFTAIGLFWSSFFCTGHVGHLSSFSAPNAGHPPNSIFDKPKPLQRHNYNFQEGWQDIFFL